MRKYGRFDTYTYHKRNVVPKWVSRRFAGTLSEVSSNRRSAGTDNQRRGEYDVPKGRTISEKKK
jgi:hypothetical protein